MIAVAEHDVETPVDIDAELAACALDFSRWCRWLQVEDKVTNEYVPFQPYPGQLRVVRTLFRRRKIWAPKARRTGMSTQLNAVPIWLGSFNAFVKSVITSQDEATSTGLLQMIVGMIRNLPEWLQPVIIEPTRITTKTRELWFKGGGCIVTRIVGEKTGRSEGIDYAMVDEACYCDDLRATIEALQASVTRSKGMMAVTSTVRKQGTPSAASAFVEFKAGYDAAKAGLSDFAPVFLSCFDLPGQDEEWYERESALHAHEPGYMLREHPRNDRECFESVGGLVYPSLRRETHFTGFKRDDTYKLYRGMDFGQHERSAFVCVWVAHDPTKPPRLTFEPDCDEVVCSEQAVTRYPNGLDQLFAYVRDAHGKPKDEHNDLADALRYVVTQYRMTGHVHVYRILFIRCDDHMHVQPMHMFRMVMERSGLVLRDAERNLWRRGPKCEDYEGTVCDKSGKGFISILQEQRGPYGFDMDVVPYDPPQEFTTRAIEDGVTWINNLLIGTDPVRVGRHMSVMEQQVAAYQRGDRPTGMAEAVKFRRWTIQGKKRKRFVA